MILEKTYTQLIKEFLKEKGLKPSKIQVIEEDDGFVMVFADIKNLSMKKALDLSYEATGKLLEETGKDVGVSIIPK